jgi:hypothetical protein
MSARFIVHSGQSCESEYTSNCMIESKKNVTWTEFVKTMEEARQMMKRDIPKEIFQVIMDMFRPYQLTAVSMYGSKVVTFPLPEDYVRSRDLLFFMSQSFAPRTDQDLNFMIAHIVSDVDKRVTFFITNEWVKSSVESVMTRGDAVFCDKFPHIKTDPHDMEVMLCHVRKQPDFQGIDKKVVESNVSFMLKLATYFKLKLTIA